MEKQPKIGRYWNDSTFKKEIHIYIAFTQRAVPGIEGEWQKIYNK